MRLPRVRFTVGLMMLLVAIIALWSPSLLSLFTKLKYLYDTPSSANLVWTQVGPHGFDWSKRGLAGQPVAVKCWFRTDFSDQIPEGIPYRVTLEIRLIRVIGRKTRVVESSHRLSRYVFSENGYSSVNMLVDLNPNHKGDYEVEYEALNSDLFGRKGLPRVESQDITVH